MKHFDLATGGLEAAQLIAFVAESNHIEGINRPPTSEELNAHVRLMDLDVVTIPDLEAFVSVVAPGHVLRRNSNQNVRVGRHIAPRGGPDIEDRLNHLLSQAPESVYKVHVQYEILHPFTDGNGRSGRALWLWGMAQIGQLDKALALGFLHLFYYQTLSVAR